MAGHGRAAVRWESETMGYARTAGLKEGRFSSVVHAVETRGCRKLHDLVYKPLCYVLINIAMY